MGPKGVGLGSQKYGLSGPEDPGPPSCWPTGSLRARLLGAGNPGATPAQGFFLKSVKLPECVSFLHPYLGPGTVLNAAMASASTVPCPVGTVYNPHFIIMKTVALGSGVFSKVTHLVEGRTEDYHSNPDPSSILHSPHLACSVFLAQSTAKLCTLLPLLLQQNKRDIRSGNKTQVKHLPSVTQPFHKGSGVRKGRGQAVLTSAHWEDPP